MFDPEIRYTGPRKVVVDNNQSPIAYWELNKQIIDEQVVIIGGGPSHADLNIDLLKNIQFIAINSACRKVTKISKEKDLLYFSDNSWSERFIGLINDWNGKIVTCNRNSKIRLGNLINRIDLEDLVQFMQIKSDCVQASSGHVGACLAARLGAKKIILIGFECKKINDRTHGHDDYVMENLRAFEERFIPSWVGLGIGFKRLGIKVINSTPDSDIKNFPFLPLEEAIRL